MATTDAVSNAVLPTITPNQTQPGACLNTTLNVLLAAQCILGKIPLERCIPAEEWPSDGSRDLSDLNFDFIIVGAGSAGSVLANRLTEFPCWRVLLIEAGGDPPVISSIPSLSGQLINSAYDWQYKSINDSRICQGLRDGKCTMPRGKMLGGSSSMNFMHYVRGNSLDYDNIALSGNYGWNYNQIMKYFIKSENLTQPQVENDPILRQYHGYNGQLNVKPFSFYGTHPMVPPLIDAFTEIGSSQITDVNGPSQYGSVRLQGTVHRGRRQSTARAFLIPARNRKNLVIWKYALASKIVFNGTTATGVKVILETQIEVEVKARKEVIISAGTINTPQLLLLSGVGPKDHLRQHEINVVADLPVGENLYDHVAVPTIIGFRNGVPPVSSVAAIAQYIVNRTGPLAGIGTAEVSRFFSTLGDTSGQPDIQTLLIYFDANSSDLIAQFLGIGFSFNDQTTDSIINYNKELPILLTITILLNERSRGKINLVNTDPKTAPNYIPNFLSDERDVEPIVRALENIEELTETESFKKLGAVLVPFDLPACNRLRFPSRAYRTCVTYHLGQTCYHPLGTAKMGPLSDSTTVVDSSLRVHNVQRLRVVDGSVIPSQISGNTNAPIIMFAEKASDLVKNDYKTC